MAIRWVVISMVLCAACGGQPQVSSEIPPTPRRMVVWLESSGLDMETADRLQSVGVDEVVIRRGRLDLAGLAPVLRVDPVGPVEGAIPLGIALDVTGVREDLDEATAEAVWSALESDLGGDLPAEVILDLPELADGLGDFLVSLQQVSGLSVVPLLSISQLQTAQGVEVARAARSCVVPSFGTDGGPLRGIGELDPLPLREKLAPLAETGVRVRIATALEPRTVPRIDGPGDDLDPLTENGVAVVSTSSILDRTFTFQRTAVWSGRAWPAGESIAIRWMDAARLRAALEESHRMILPEMAGWDLVSLPPEPQRLGLGREALIRYLGGEGPEPAVELDVRRSGRSVQIRLANPGPFATAVSNHGNFVEVSVEDGWLTMEGKGSFDRLTRGTVSRGTWEQGDFDRVNAVRLFEIYLAPGEEVVSGTARTPSSRSRVAVQYSLTLFDGANVSGTVYR